MHNRTRICNIMKHVMGAMVNASLMSIFAVILSKMDAEEIGMQLSFPQMYLGSLSALIPYTVSLIGVLFFNNFAIFAALSAASEAVILILPIPGLLKAIVMLTGAFMIIFRGSARTKGTEDFMMKPNAVWMALFVVAYILAGGYENSLMLNLNYYLCFAYAICLIIYMNLFKLNSYLDFNKNIENIPYRQISRTNYGTLAIYLILTLSAMIILPRIGIDNLITGLGQAVKALLMKIINIDTGADASEAASKATDPSYDMGNPMEAIGGGGETPAWLTAFYQGATYVCIALCIIAAIAVLIYVAMRLMKQFYRTDNEEIDREEFIPTTKDRRESTKGFRDIVKRPEWLDFSPNAQVRRQYRKTILQAAKEPVKPSMTPAEAEAFAGLENDQKTSLLHELYEKARYTEEGCSKADARSLKN